MDKIKIFLSDDSELADYAFIDKCFRSDVLVQIGNELYKPNFYHIVRLTQEYNDSISANEVYEIDNNVVLVEETSKKKIIEAILALHKAKYFNKVKPINLLEEYNSYSTELQKLSNWKQVY